MHRLLTTRTQHALIPDDVCVNKNMVEVLPTSNCAQDVAPRVAEPRATGPEEMIAGRDKKAAQTVDRREVDDSVNGDDSSDVCLNTHGTQMVPQEASDVHPTDSVAESRKDTVIAPVACVVLGGGFVPPREGEHPKQQHATETSSDAEPIGFPPASSTPQVTADRQQNATEPSGLRLPDPPNDDKRYRVFSSDSATMLLLGSEGEFLHVFYVHDVSHFAVLGESTHPG